MRYNKDFIDFVKSISIEDAYEEVFGQRPPAGKFFCPFHHNVNTPAAKVYGNSIKCFSCNRSYSTFDLYYKFMPEKLSYLAKHSPVKTTFNVSQQRSLKAIKYLPFKPSCSDLHPTIELLDSLANYE